MKHCEIIAKFGGVTEMAHALGHKNRTTVKYWEEQGEIPEWRWHQVLQAAKSKRLGIKASDFHESSP